MGNCSPSFSPLQPNSVYTDIGYTLIVIVDDCGVRSTTGRGFSQKRVLALNVRRTIPFGTGVRSGCSATFPNPRGRPSLKIRSLSHPT